MEKYWYLFEAHGRQVLVRKGENDDNAPTIDLVVKIAGAEISFAVIYGNEGGEEERDRMFDTKAEELEGAATAFAERFIGITNPMDALAALQG